MIDAVEPPTLLASDRQIGEAIRQALLAKMPKAAPHITVCVERGIVHLWGIIGSDEEPAEVSRIVAALPGARAVRDHRRDAAWPD
jgi:osmotically-inducible protein OsmY